MVDKINDDDMINLKLKSTSDSKEYLISIKKTSCCDDLRKKAAEVLSIPSNKNIRLILSGKLLDPPAELLSTFNCKSGAFIHVAVSDKVVVVPPPIHTSAILSRSQLKGLDILLSSETDETFVNPLFRYGFHLSINEVSSLRTSYRIDIDNFIREHQLTTLTTENDISFRLRCEHIWLETIDNNSEFYQNLPQNNISNNNNNTNNQSLISLNYQRFLDFQSNGQLNESETHIQSQTQAIGTNSDYFYGFFLGYVLGNFIIHYVNSYD